jgi:hypothetical protein
MQRKESLQRLELENQISYVEEQITMLQAKRSDLLMMLKEAAARKA